MARSAGNRVALRRASFALTFIALIVMACMSRAQPTAKRIGDVAEISIGDDLKFSKSDEKMPDFSVYYVRKKASIILGIYIGNAPDVDINKLTDRMKLGNCSSVPTATQVKSSYHFDAIVQLKGPDFPRFVHLFSRNLPAADFAEVQQLLRSFKLLAPYAC